MDDFDLQDFLPYLLNQAAEASSREFQRLYKDRYGMVRTEWRVLFHLGMFGPLTARAICDRASIHKTKISRAVARLETRRFLTRARDDADRRAEWLTLTPAGLAAFADLRSVAAEYDSRLTAGFSPVEAALLRRMLCQLAGRPARPSA